MYRLSTQRVLEYVQAGETNVTSSKAGKTYPTLLALDAMAMHDGHRLLVSRDSLLDVVALVAHSVLEAEPCF